MLFDGTALCRAVFIVTPYDTNHTRQISALYTRKPTGSPRASIDDDDDDDDDDVQ